MRQPKPYHKHIGKGKNAKGRGWYANIGPNGRPVRLATEEEGETVAWNKYHSLMAGRQPIKVDCRVVDLFARFLEYHKLRSADATVDFYANALHSFGEFVGNLRVCDLTPQHIDEWIERCHWTVKRTGKPTSNNYRRNLIRAVKAAFRWGQRKQKIPNPVADYELPPARPRDTYLTPAQSENLFAEVARSRDRGALLDMVTILRETGCRPGEARRVEARHLDREGRRWVFEREESKGKRSKRIVKLTDTAFELCCRLALKHPEGPLFRMRNGKPWNRHTLGYRLYRLSKKLGFKVTPYTIRHAWATDAIARGASLQAIALFLGHSSLRMLTEVYQHVDRRDDFLEAEFRKAVGQ